jgi:hypothetical protein
VNNAVANETVDNKMPPNMRFQPTASLACARSRRLKRGPLGTDEMNVENDNAWLLGQVAWRGMLPAQVTFGR